MTKPSKGASGCLLQERLNQDSILVEIVRPSIWQLCGSPRTQDLNVGAVCGNTKSLIQSPAKMATTSRSRSSGRGEEDNSEWHQAIERRQLASERQLQVLLQETERLREENAVLRIQASSTGPPRCQRLRGQVANSRPKPESIYPETAGPIPDTYNVRQRERHAPIHQTPLEESSSSTRLSSKRQRDRRSQLSGATRARLGPQEHGRPLCDAPDWHRAIIYSAAQPAQKHERGRPKPPVAPTRGTHPDPMVTSLVQNVPPHRDPMVTPMVQNI